MASPRYLKRDARGTWYVHWTENRVGKRVTTGTKEVREAEAFLAAWLKEERAAAGEANPAATIGDCWKRYDAHHVQKNVMARKKAEYYWTLLEPHFGALAVSDLSQDAVDAYRRAREKTVKPSTVRNELGYMIAAINFCTVKPHKLVEPAVAEGVTDALTLPPTGAPRERWLRAEEMEKLHAAAREMRAGARLSRGERFLWLALETAARKEAILDLTWDRVDFETGTVDFNVPGRQLTKKRRANVPMSKALRAVLKRAYAERGGDLVMDNKGEVWATVQSIVIRAGLAPKQKIATGAKPKATGVSPHVFRHTAATHMARRGVPLWVISRVLGNSLAVVEKTYAKWQPGAMQAAVDMISGSEAVDEEKETDE